MPYTFEQLSAMNVSQLREIAQGIEHEAVKGFSTMHKDKLASALCVALGIEGHAHHAAARADKSKIKLEIRDLKKKRDTAIEKKDYVQLKEIRNRIHDLKRTLRKSIV